MSMYIVCKETQPRVEAGPNLPTTVASNSSVIAKVIHSSCCSFIPLFFLLNPHAAIEPGQRARQPVGCRYFSYPPTHPLTHPPRNNVQTVPQRRAPGTYVHSYHRGKQRSRPGTGPSCTLVPVHSPSSCIMAASRVYIFACSPSYFHPSDRPRLSCASFCFSLNPIPSASKTLSLDHRELSILPFYPDLCRRSCLETA